MKKILLILMVLTGAFSFLRAQSCEPATDLPDSVIVSPLPYSEENPMQGIQDTACANSYYETVLTFKIPSTVEINGNPFPVQSVDVPTENAIVNLPASFDYVCNPPDCVFEADSLGCIVVFGEATPADVGVHDLKVTVTIRTLIDYNTSLPDGTIVNGNYFFFVKEEGSENCTIISGIDNPLTREVSLSNRPNPFGSLTEIVINANISGSFDFVVTGLFGAELYRENVELLEGENILPFDGSQLPEGMYLYTITDGKHAATGKMVVNRF